MTIDWLAATNQQRKGLYRQLKRAADLRDKKVEQLCFEIAGRELGTDYAKTLRAGTFARRTTHQYFEWLRQNEPDLAEAIEHDDEIVGPVQSDWFRFFKDHTVTGALRIVPRGLAIVSLARKKPIQKLKLSQEFYLQLDSPMSGIACALQYCSGKWFPLALTDAYSATVPKGMYKLPQIDGAIDYLCETEHTGPHEIAIIICQTAQPASGLSALHREQPISSAILDSIVSEFDESDASVAVLRTRFTVKEF